MPQQVTLGPNIVVTKHQVGLGNVTNDEQLKADQLGVDVCPLVSGKVPADKLPPVGAVQSVNGKVGDVVVAFDDLEGNPFAPDEVVLKANSYRIKAEHTEVQHNQGYTVETTPPLPFTHNGIVLESVNLDINQYDWKLSYGRLKWYAQFYFPAATNQPKDMEFRSCLIQNGEEICVNEAAFGNQTLDYSTIGYDWSVDTRIPIESINITFRYTLAGQDDFVEVDVKFIGPFVSYPSKLVIDETLLLRDIDVYHACLHSYPMIAAEDIQKNKAVVLDENGIRKYQVMLDYATPSITPPENIFHELVDDESFSVHLLNDNLYVFYTMDGTQDTYMKRFNTDGSTWIEQQQIMVPGKFAKSMLVDNTLYCVISKETGTPSPDTMYSVIFKIEIAPDGVMTGPGPETVIDAALTIQRGIWRMSETRLIANHQNLNGIFDGTGTKEYMVLIDSDTLAVLDSFLLPRPTIEENTSCFERVDDTHLIFGFHDNGFTLNSIDISGDTISVVHTVKPSPENSGRGELFAIDSQTYALLSRDSTQNQFIRAVYLDENYHISYGPYTEWKTAYTITTRSTEKNILIYYGDAEFRMAVFKIDTSADQYEVLRDDLVMVAGNYHLAYTFMNGETFYAFFATEGLKMLRLEPASGGSVKPVGFALGAAASGETCRVACGDIVPGFEGLTVGAKYGLDPYGAITLDAGGDYIAIDEKTIKYMGG